MRKSQFFLYFSLMAAPLLATEGAAVQIAPQLRADNIDEVVNAMTLEEKARLVVGGGNKSFGDGTTMVGNQKKIVSGAAGVTVAIPRLGIPATVLTDGPAGVRIDPTREGSSQTYYATGFPIGTCLACTWNTDLVKNVGKAIGNETLEYGCDVVLGPGMNIHRNPLCGRNFEYYSEDPFVTGAIATAYVKGVQSQGVGVSSKHFAVNSQETDRTKVDERVSPRTLREIYLRGFEKMVRESKPWTLMSSYNLINGQFAMGSKDLLTDILRKDWGVDGMVMTDWDWRVYLPINEELTAGTDLLMPGLPFQMDSIIAMVKSGKLSMKDLDVNVHRMLQFIVRTPHFKNYNYSEKPDLKAHAQITRQSSTEGMVLLKNANETLPFQNVKKVALFGVNSYDFSSGGLGSGSVNVPYVVDMVDGLKNVGISTTQTLTDIYKSYVKYARFKLKVDKNPAMWFLDNGQPKLDEIEITERCIQHEMAEADAAVITIGRQAGEAMDRSIENDFNLSPLEQRLIHNVSGICHSAGKRVIVIINSGSVIETASWREFVDAILVAWQPGEEGGNSVADVLTGKANPSGKLTMTWPIAAVDHYSTRNFPQEYDMYTYKNMETYIYGNIKGIDYSNHEEDIYVGYRYFDTFKRQVAYPFGFGLSYTNFVYSKSEVTLNKKTSEIEVSVVVTNIGKTAGKEVAQVYVTAPKGKLEKPTKELKAFAKTKLLQPGESETLRMRVAQRDLASFDESNSQWLVEAGAYQILIGSNSADIKATLSVNVSSYTEKVSDVLHLKEPLNLLRK
ncbi:MAG TPA: glycoside hydrolase family 3 C-terminal domain-containing protein [Paludibacteraceae bacterium]|nr:glycoside hydrolase family 3 C-terminal domain-containing protein [Paludibacteraceae bacterium]